MHLNCEKYNINGYEYIRIDDTNPIWFVWSKAKEEYLTVYNSEELENQYRNNYEAKIVI